MTSFLKPSLRVGQAIFALFLTYFALRLLIYHFCLVTYPYPNTFREGAMMTSTTALVHGLNPYDMSLQPAYMNQYGIIYPFLVWPLAQLFGVTMIVHRVVTALSILASCALIFLVLRRMLVPVLLNIWAVLMLYSSLLYPATSTPAIDPAATGMFFMLLSIFIPWFKKYSYTSLILSVIFGLLSFYSKPYTFLGVPVMATYLFLFVSKKKSVFYGLLLLVLSAISIIGINQIFPAYFDNCFFTSLNMTANWMSAERLHMQVHLYTQIHLWTLILLAAFALGYAINNFRSLPTLKIASWWQLAFNAPLLKLNCPLVLYAGLCAAFVLYVSLGRHTGATLWYFFQLLSPFFVLGSAWVFGRFSYWPILCVPFLILNLFIITADQNHKYFNKNCPGWSNISQVISQHDHILNSCLLAPLLIEQNKEFFDDGQTEYFMSGAPRKGLMGNFFKEDDRVYYQGVLFFDNIRYRVEHKMFDVIMLQPSLLPGGVAEDIRKYYKYEGRLALYVPQDRRPYDISIWVPL